MRRPFRTPLVEVSAQIDLATQGLVDLRAQAYYDIIKSQYDLIQKLPMILIAPDESNPASLHGAAYRFFSQDRKKLVQLGPRMMAYNVVNAWTGFEDFKAAALSAVQAYAGVMGRPIVKQYSLACFNRIPVYDFAEMSEILRIAGSFESDTIITDMFLQYAREVPEGTVLSQYQSMKPDALTPETYIGVNNHIRFTISDNTPLDVGHWVWWLDEAHERAKVTLWEALTNDARASWKENDAPIISN